MAPRAVFAIPGDPAARTGGYIYDRRLGDGLRALGWQVDILRLDASFPDPTDAAAAAALAAFAGIPPDAVILADGLAYGAMPSAGLAAVRAPICALVHHPLALESGLDPARAAALKATERANLAVARHVVVTSAHTADTVVDAFAVARDRITVAVPGVDRPETPQRARAGPPRILAVGSLTRRKGHDVLLAALARIADLDWSAEIVGGAHDPSVAGAIEAQRSALGLDARLDLRGEVDAAELDACYAAADLFALATRYEGYGMVFTEALARRLPIISCAVGAVPNTVPQDAGLLTPPDDPDAFAAALRRVLTEPETLARLRAGASAAAENLPTWAATAATVDGALRRLVPAIGR